MAMSFRTRLTAFLNRAGLSPSYLARQLLAAHYLRGAGLEIGALDHPLRLPENVRVTYVDYLTKEENLRRYPGLDPERTVTPQLLEDGLTLASVATASQDFLIANHVLEHADNPIQALRNWERTLKTGGILFLSVPNGKRCFDKDRPLTTIEHLQADFDAGQSGDSAASYAMNREHYREWLASSLPRIQRSFGTPVPKLTPAEQEASINAMQAAGEEIHYHVFSRNSLRDFMEHVTSRYLPGLKLLQLFTSVTGAEFIVIARKQE